MFRFLGYPHCFVFSDVSGFLRSWKCFRFVGCGRSVEMASLHQYSGPLANGLEEETLALDVDEDSGDGDGDGGSDGNDDYQYDD